MWRADLGLNVCQMDVFFGKSLQENLTCLCSEKKVHIVAIVYINTSCAFISARDSFNITCKHYDLIYSQQKKISPRLLPLPTQCDVFLDCCCKISCYTLYFSSKIAWFSTVFYSSVSDKNCQNLSLKNQAIFEEKYSAQHILLLAWHHKSSGKHHIELVDAIIVERFLFSQ